MSADTFAQAVKINVNGINYDVTTVWGFYLEHERLIQQSPWIIPWTTRIDTRLAEQVAEKFGTPENARNKLIACDGGLDAATGALFVRTPVVTTNGFFETYAVRVVDLSPFSAIQLRDITNNELRHAVRSQMYDAIPAVGRAAAGRWWAVGRIASPASPRP